VRQLLGERRAAGGAILLSTHNLDEAERLADRVAVLQGRLLALDRPAALRQRLTTGRVVVRVAGDVTACLPVARRLDPAAVAEGGTLTLTLPRTERDTPALVRALVAAGVDVLEVRAEVPALEDVYLRLVAGESGDAVGAAS
jgi:ABC-2 type transport system ATP-binding protein